MTEIIFAKPVHNYDSYSDFWRLVELSGFRTIRVDEIDITRDQIVITAPMNGDYKEYFVGNLKHWEETGEITGGELKRQKDSGLPQLTHLIIWNLERPAGSGSIGNYASECFKWMYAGFANEVWVSDPSMADQTMLRYVILGSDYGLGEPGRDSEKRYDFAHMSLQNPRRMHIYKNFDNGAIGPNCWPWDEDPNRDDVLKRSKFALNVHQDNYPFCEPLRFALFAAYGLPIISETLRSSFPYGNDVATVGYHDLVAALQRALGENYGEWKDRGMRLRKKLCEDLQFGRVVRQAIKESVGIGWR